MNKTLHYGLLQNMAIFKEVAELGSFSQVAQTLQMTPSSVSKRITELEDKLGTKLIERTTRSMRLTPTGEQVLKHCRNMLGEADLAIQVINQAQESMSGDVSIGVPKAFANHVLKPLLAEFLLAYPDIHLRVMVTDDPLDLLRERINCAIEISQSPSDYVIAKPLLQVRQVLCATPQYLQNHPQPISNPTDLLAHDCIYLSETQSDDEWTFINREDKNLDAVSVRVSGRYAVNHTGMRLDGILNHLGVGCLPDFVAKPHLKHGHIVEVLPEWDLQSKYQGTAWVTYLPNKFQPLRLKVFIEFLRDNLAIA